MSDEVALRGELLVEAGELGFQLRLRGSFSEPLRELRPRGEAMGSAEFEFLQKFWQTFVKKDS